MRATTQTRTIHWLDPFKKTRILCWILVFASFTLNTFSLFLPFVTVKKILHAPEVYSLLRTISLMYHAELYFLAFIIIVFSILFPFVKLGALIHLLSSNELSQKNKKILSLVGFWGKWSMLDIFIVCFVLALTNNQLFIDSSPHIGILTFLSAIICSLSTSTILEILSHKIIPRKKPTQLSHYSTVKTGVLLLGSSSIFITLLFIPFLQINDWLLRDHPLTLFSFFRALMQQDAFLVSPILAIGTILLPTLELGLLWFFWIQRLSKKASHHLPTILTIIRNWSLLDVFFIALLSFLIEAGQQLMTLETRTSIYLLGGMFIFYQVYSFVMRKSISS